MPKHTIEPGEKEYYKIKSNDPGQHLLEIKNENNGKYHYALVLDQNRTFLINSKKHIKDEDVRLNDALDAKLEEYNITHSVDEILNSDPIKLDKEVKEHDLLSLKGWRIKGGLAWLELDGEKKEVKIIEKTIKDGREVNVPIEFIDAYPSRVLIKQSPLTQKTEYNIKWISKRAKYPFETEGSPQSIINDLQKGGYLLNSEKPIDRLSIMLKELHKSGVSQSDYKIDIPGFFNLNDEIVAANYDMTPPTEPEVFAALEMLERFASYFGSENIEIDQRAKISTVFKLCLSMPFNYVRKQLGHSEVIKPPMAYGKPGSGKTTINLIPAYVFNLDLDTYEGAGSNIQTVARFAELMGKTTFPTLIDEAWNVFDDKTMVEMNKTGLRRLYVRNKLTKDGRKIEEPAYSTFIYISNHPPIKDSMDGTVRRYHIHSYDELEYKKEDDQQVKQFDSFFKLRDPDSPLKALEAIGRFSSNYILKNPEILSLDMLEAGDVIVNELYALVGREVPEWLKWEAKTETLEDYSQSEKDRIKGFIFESMIREYNKKILVEAEERPRGGKQTDLTSKSDDDALELLKDELYQVGKNRLISWIFYREHKSHFIIKPHFVDELTRKKGIVLSFKSISQKFQGWEYTTGRDDDQKVSKLIKIPSDVFYETIIDENDE